MTADHLEKRNHLKDLSADAQILVKMGKVDTVNEGIKLFYANLGHTELKTFGKWKELGFQVMKGEKALLLWAKPLHVQKEEPKPEGAPFFPVVYLFSNLQVEPLKK